MKQFDFPPLEEEHFKDAKIFANRNVMIKSIAHPAENIAEIGVALGDFSRVLIDLYTPKQFVAFDMFTMHEFPKVWFTPSNEIFKGKTHLEYIREKFQAVNTNFVIEKGASQELLLKYPDNYFDMIYVDGDHNLEPVARDAEIASRKVKSNGTLIFNDYILHDPFSPHDHVYGVVQAVNKLCVFEGWKVVGFSLHHLMFCDIVLKKF